MFFTYQFINIWFDEKFYSYFIFCPLHVGKYLLASIITPQTSRTFTIKIIQITKFFFNCFNFFLIVLNRVYASWTRLDYVRIRIDASIVNHKCGFQRVVSTSIRLCVFFVTLSSIVSFKSLHKRGRFHRSSMGINVYTTRAVSRVISLLYFDRISSG